MDIRGDHFAVKRKSRKMEERKRRGESTLQNKFCGAVTERTKNRTVKISCPHLCFTTAVIQIPID